MTSTPIHKQYLFHKKSEKLQEQKQTTLKNLFNVRKKNLFSYKFLNSIQWQEKMDIKSIQFLSIKKHLLIESLV